MSLRKEKFRICLVDATNILEDQESLGVDDADIIRVACALYVGESN